MSKDISEKRFLWFIFFLAFGLRLTYLVFLKNTYFFYGHPGDDVVYYQTWAESIALENWVGTSAFSGMPLFAYYLAVLYKIFLGHWLAVNIFNLGLGAVNCVLIYCLAKNLFSTKCAILAAFLSATNFVLIYYDWLMMPVTLLISLSLIILLALSDQQPKLFREWFLLGIFIGLASLGDGKFLIFAMIILLFLIWSSRKNFFPEAFKKTFPLLLGLVLIIGGTTLRNRIISGEWIFITSQSGLSFYVGNNPQANGAFESPDFIRPSHAGQDEDQRIFVEKTLKRKVTWTEVSKFYTSQAVNFIINDPLAYFRLLSQKIILFATDSEKSHDIDMVLQRDLKVTLDFNPYILIFPIALIGIFLETQNRGKGQFAIFLIAGHLIYCLIFFVTTRQRAPILPVLIIFESYAFLWITDKFKSCQYKALAKTGIFLVSCALFFPPKFLDTNTYVFLNRSKTGSVYEKKKDYQKAAKAFEEAHQILPTDPNTLFNLGTAYLHQKEYQKAQTFFLSAIKFGKFNIDATFNLGYIHEQTGDMDKALQAYQQVLKNTPESLDAAFRIATVYQTQGNCSQAKIYYERIIALKPFLRAEIEKKFSQCTMSP